MNYKEMRTQFFGKKRFEIVRKVPKLNDEKFGEPYLKVKKVNEIKHALDSIYCDEYCLYCVEWHDEQENEKWDEYVAVLKEEN